jgi:hypothetical protein
VVEDQHTDRIIVSQSRVLQALRRSIRRGFVLEDCQHNDLVCHEHPFPWNSNSNTIAKTPSRDSEKPSVIDDDSRRCADPRPSDFPFPPEDGRSSCSRR